MVHNFLNFYFISKQCKISWCWKTAHSSLSLSITLSLFLLALLKKLWQFLNYFSEGRNQCLKHTAWKVKILIVWNIDLVVVIVNSVLSPSEPEWGRFHVESWQVVLCFDSGDPLSLSLHCQSKQMFSYSPPPNSGAGVASREQQLLDCQTKQMFSYSPPPNC